MTFSPTLAVEEVKSTASWIIDAGGWTACVFIVLIFVWAIHIKRKFIPVEELLNERAERERERKAHAEEEAKSEAMIQRLQAALDASREQTMALLETGKRQQTTNEKLASSVVRQQASAQDSPRDGT